MYSEHEYSKKSDIDAAPQRLIPPNPDVTAYHWIRRYLGGPSIPLWWNSTWHTGGGEGWGKWAQPDRESQWVYCGPCTSPDDLI